MDLVVEDGDEVLVEDLLFLVGDVQEALVGLFEFLLGERVAELLEAVAEAVAAGAGGQDDAALGRSRRPRGA